MSQDDYSSIFQEVTPGIKLGRMIRVELRRRDRIKSRIYLCKYRQCDETLFRDGLCESHLFGPTRVDALSYRGVHKQLVVVRGSAKNYNCLNCGSLPSEWAYDGQDEEEIREARGRVGAGCFYSTDLSHYMPLCKLCHGKFDSIHKQEKNS